MAIRAKSEIVVARARTRTASFPVPDSPPPTLATWAIDIAVEDASRMYQQAAVVMAKAGKTAEEIVDCLRHESGVVDIARCMDVLFAALVQSIGVETGCSMRAPQLYLEPLLDARDD